jgi:hypothetical protein
MSGRTALALVVVGAFVTAFAGAFAAAAVGPAVVVAGPAHPVCAQPLPARAISSPGWMRELQTPQVVAYLAVIGTRTA